MEQVGATSMTGARKVTGTSNLSFGMSRFVLSKFFTPCPAVDSVLLIC